MTDPILEQDAALADMVKRLVDAFHPLRIYLFGPRARGEIGPDSDYDLMVLVPDDASPGRARRSGTAYQALRGTGVAADVLVWTLNSFEKRLTVVASLPAVIQREGKLLYAA